MRGYTVRYTSTKDSFFKELNIERPNIVLLDVMLSEADGREICYELKTNDSTKDIPTILMSASPSTLRDYKTLHADGIIEKPFNISDLVIALHNHMQR
ncbi:response regulator [Ferruginibacter albus]|uniref:response regulator n=1 Tax=Ferruginibacter albus TaxID=2875540 RepID=UPI001CC47E08|nr:response regulator [Ferruginibacter albus]UAY52879.1 response regulator [Ferruginibacter albus]